MKGTPGGPSRETAFKGVAIVRWRGLAPYPSGARMAFVEFRCLGLDTFTIFEYS
jgi:hypothetical protein